MTKTKTIAIDLTPDESLVVWSALVQRETDAKRRNGDDSVHAKRLAAVRKRLEDAARAAGSGI